MQGPPRIRPDLQIAWVEQMIRDLQVNGPHYNISTGTRIAALHKRLAALREEHSTAAVDTVADRA